MKLPPVGSIGNNVITCRMITVPFIYLLVRRILVVTEGAAIVCAPMEAFSAGSAYQVDTADAKDAGAC